MNRKILVYKKYLPITLVVIFFTFVFSFHSIIKHLLFNSNALDLGIYTQVSYLYSQGLAPLSSIRHMNLLGDHFEVILLLISPIYKLFPFPETLLIVQAIFVALSSIPIYLIAKDKIKNNLLSLLIVIIYQTSVGITAAINFDFHTTTISVLPLSLTLYFWYFKRWRLYWLTLFLAILFKEDVPIFLLGLGIFQIFRKQFKLGILTSIFSVISFVVIKFYLMPFFWPGGDQIYIDRSVFPLTNPLKLISLFLTQPGLFIDQMTNSAVKAHTFENLYRQYAYLPFFSLFGWLTILPALFLRFSSTATATWTLIWHYNANLEPFLAVSAIFVISRFRLTKILITFFLILFLISQGLNKSSMFWEPFQNNTKNIHDFNYINNSISYIPNSAAVSAQSPIVPHVSNRKRVYMFPDISGADYIILDTSLITYPLTKADLENKIVALKKNSDWKVDKTTNTLIVFRRINSSL